LYCNSGTPEGCIANHNHEVGCYIKHRASLRPPTGLRYKGRIILEGPDRAGKTTIANSLKKLGYFVVHCEYKERHSDIVTHYESLLDIAIDPIVFDRSFISEVVYGKIQRGGSRLPPQSYENLLRRLSNNGFKVLYVTENQTVLRDRFDATEKGNAGVETLAQLMEEYDRAMNVVSNFVPVIRIIPSVMSQANILELVANAEK